MNRNTKTCSRGHTFLGKFPCPKCYPGYYKNVEWDVSFQGEVEKFPGAGGWVYVAVPEKYTNTLNSEKRAWGMFPITAYIGYTHWSTKLMSRKRGGYFVALRSEVRKEAGVTVGDKVTVSFKLN